MAGKRLYNTTELTDFDSSYKLAVDKTGTLQAANLSLALVGNAYIQGSEDGISYHNKITSSDTYYRVSTDGGTTWHDITPGAGGGSVTEVTSTTTNQLTVATGTSTPALSIVTATVANGGTALATGDQIYDFVTGLGYLTAVAKDTTLTGNGTSGSPLSVDKTGDWTGTFDGQQGTYYLSRTNHSGTQLASTISDLTTAINNNTNVSTAYSHVTSNGTSHSYINQDVTTTASPLFRGLRVSTGIANPSYAEGLVFYDNTKKALSYYNDEADVTINLAQESVQRVYNNSGSTISNGKVVYISGVFSGEKTIALADASEYSKSRIIGIATHDIENSSYGYVTKFGEVGGLNTSSFSVGDVLYLDCNTPGAISTSPASGGCFEVYLGEVLVSSSTEGKIFVDPIVSGLTREINDVNGFPSSQRVNTTLSFVNGTRTFTITPTASTFYYYINGIKYIKTGAQSIVIPDTEGLHAIYYDGDTLTTVLNPSDGDVDTVIREACIVAYVYWDATNNLLIGDIMDERHGISMSPVTHSYLHFTRGAQYLTGLSLSGLLVDQNGSSNTHAQFGVTSGMTADEDITHMISSITSTTGLPILYLSGANGDLRETSNSGYAFPVGATPLPQYNQWTGTVWQLTEVTSGNFVLVHVYAINGQTKKIFSVVGQNQYTTVGAARTGAQTEINSLSTGQLPMPEFVPIATAILEVRTSYTNSVNARYVSTLEGDSYVDWRNTETSGAGAAPTDHGNLTGLADDDHTQYHTDTRADTWFTTKNLANLGTKSHTSLTDIGTNTHAQIDSHIANVTTNPHNVTKANVGLGNVENTALSTWAGSSNLTILGTIGTGVWQGTAITDTYISSAATWNAKQNALTFGIANTNAVKIDGTVELNDYARFTSTGLVGRTYAEVKTDLSLNNVENTALSTWTGSTNIITLGTINTGTWNATTIGISAGGTGQTTASGAINALLPSQTGNSGKYLTTNGTVASWNTIAGGGNVSNTGTPVDNQIAVWTNSSTIEGTSGLTYDGTNLLVTGSLGSTSARVTKGWLTDLEITNMPTINGTSLTTATQTLQNKTITNSNNTLGKVTMGLGSDADGDMYYRSSALLSRLAKGTAYQKLTMNSGATAPNWTNDFETIGVACSDMTTAITVGEKVAFDVPFNFVVTRVYASIKTAPTGSAMTIDIEDEGTTILNAVLSIAASANNAETSTFTGSATSYTFTKGDLISIDVDSIGSTVAGAGLIVFLEGYRT